MPIDPDAIYDEDETGELMSVSTRTLQRGRVDGTGPAYVRLSRARIGYTGRAILNHQDANTYRSVAAELSARKGAAKASRQ